MRNVFHYGTIGSTNEIALVLAARGLGHFTVITAKEQTAGRGRRGAEWISPSGSNLYCSVIVRPNTPYKPDRVPGLTFVASTAIAQALRDFGVQCGIKWPNDILARGRKISGILIESVNNGAAAVIGIGVNVNCTEFPAELSNKATSIAIETGKSVDVEKCLDQVLVRLDEALQLHEKGFDLTLKEWISLENTTGREVKTVRDGEDVKGTALGIDEKGGLLVQLASGEVITVTAAGALIEDREEQ